MPTFDDVPDSHWAKDVIYEAVAKGLFYGVSDTKFDPQGSFTRGMFVTVLSRLDGVELTENNDKFTDVSSSDYFSKAVKWASDNKIVYGISDTAFSPNLPITRQDAASILGRYFNFKGITLPETETKVTFADDAKIADYAKDWVYKMQTAGILYGKDGNAFDPLGLTTRAEAAAIFVRVSSKTS